MNHSVVTESEYTNDKLNIQTVTHATKCNEGIYIYRVWLEFWKINKLFERIFAIAAYSGYKHLLLVVAVTGGLRF